MHTGWKSREGVLEVFAKIPGGGGSRLSGKIARGVHLFWVTFIAFLLTSFLKICLGVLFHTPLTPLCASMTEKVNLVDLSDFRLVMGFLFHLNKETKLKSSQFKIYFKWRKRWDLFLSVQADQRDETCFCLYLLTGCVLNVFTWEFVFPG